LAVTVSVGMVSPKMNTITYGDRIVAMIRDRATADELMGYLEGAEVCEMGFGRPFDAERAQRVVAAVRALGPLP
jgi:hypothetical protein